MLINYSQLIPPLLNKINPVTIIIGQDLWQVNQLVSAVKKGFENAYSDPIEKNMVVIESKSDWEAVTQDINNYSLFSSPQLIDVIYNKKTLDLEAKAFLTNFLNHLSQDKALLIRASQLPLAQLKAWVNHSRVTVFNAIYPSQSTIKHWIKNQLLTFCKTYDEEVPETIYQFNQNNLTACAQLLTKLALVIEPAAHLSLAILMEYLDNQATYSLFGLSQACLMGDLSILMATLRQARINKEEPLLILWLLAQDIRLLLQLIHLTKEQPIAQAVRQLKILSIKIPWYTQALATFKDTFLMDLLDQCHQLDYQFKSSTNQSPWQALEQLALSLCVRKKVGLYD